MHTVRSLSLLALVGAALLVGCGDSQDEPQTPPSPSPEQQVKTAAQRFLDQHDASVVCRTLLTEGFVEQVFDGDVQTCTASDIAEAPKEGKQVVRDVQVDGRQASVEIVQQGGDHDGIGGHYTFVREGRAWKLDGFEDDVVRATLVVSADEAGQADGTGAFTYAPLRACVTKKFQSMPIADARDFLFASISKAPRAKKLGNEIIQRCPQQLAGYVADALANGLAQDHSAAYVSCMRKELYGLLLATGLAKEALKGNINGASSAALQGLALGADKVCSKKDGGSSA